MSKNLHLTIAGIAIDALAERPTPEELGAIVANMDSGEQAKFFMRFGGKLKDHCGYGMDQVQCTAIGEAIEELETELYDGSASRLIRMIAGALKEES